MTTALPSRKGAVEMPSGGQLRVRLVALQLQRRRTCPPDLDGPPARPHSHSLGDEICFAKEVVAAAP